MLYVLPRRVIVFRVRLCPIFYSCSTCICCIILTDSQYFFSVPLMHVLNDLFAVTGSMSDRYIFLLRREVGTAPSLQSRSDIFISLVFFVWPKHLDLVKFQRFKSSWIIVFLRNVILYFRTNTDYWLQFMRWLSCSCDVLAVN